MCSPPWIGDHGTDQTAAVDGVGGVRVEQPDQGADVARFPCLFEVSDQADPLGGRGQWRLRARMRRRAEEAS